MLGVAMLLVSVVCIVACVCCKERRNGFKEFRDSSHSIHQTGLAFTPNCGLTSASAPASELSIFPPPGATPVTFEPLPSLATLSPRARRPPGYHCQAVGDLDDWFSKKDADFPRHQLQFLKDCGRGWFGRVVEGEARGFSDARYKVMVRILREDATAAEQRLFLGEVRQYRDLDHQNVLRLVGRCLETQPYLVLLEACSAGDLKSFLRGGSPDAVERGVWLSVMCQVTEGLRHMINNGFVHTDLAARNCQVTSDLTVKVGDYGTSIDTYKDEYYIAGDVAVPVRWSAPESLHCTDTTIETKQVTPEANMWSLGVLLWEVCQLGQLPYADLTDDQVIVRVLGGSVRLPPPTRHPLHAPALYSLMCQCWGPPAARPALDHVLAMLRHLHASHSEEDFQRRWDALKPGAAPVTSEITLETMTARSDFDSGVDLEIKSTDREILDFVKKSSSDVNLTPGTASPQLSVTSSSSGGEFFSQTSLPVLQKQQSPSMTNLHGSVEDVSRPVEDKKHAGDVEEFDSWLKGVETTSEEDVKFVRKISEAIRDLDEALALEKTSSSSDDSRQGLDFRLGPMSGATRPDSPGDRRDSSGTDTEEEWRGRIERGEFSEKVKEKSKSVTDLMILTHIESESETDSLPSLTRQYSTEKKKKFSGVGVGFGSEGNIRGAVLGEEFHDALRQLQAEWRLRDTESRETSLQLVRSEQTQELDFLSNEASEKPSTLETATVATEIIEAKIVNDSLQGASPVKVQVEECGEKGEVMEKSRTVQSPETSETSHTESSSETSTPTQYEMVLTRTFVDSERAYSACDRGRDADRSTRANIVPSIGVETCPKNEAVESNCDSVRVANTDDSVGKDVCLGKEICEKLVPSECLVLGDNLLSNVVNGNGHVPVMKNEVESESGTVDVPLTVNDFLLLKDEKESSAFVPEIVVTEASILDVESESENEVVLPVTRRRNIRLVMSSSDSESEEENKLEDTSATDNSDLRAAGVATSTPFVRECRSASVDESVSNIDPTFLETTSESFFVPNIPNSAANNQESSVILGSCEDYTLDYFKGLKTTFGKQTSDESTDEFSKSEDERDDEKPVKWDEVLTEPQSHYRQNGSDALESDTDLELNNKNREENTFEYADDMDILNPKIKFEERFNDAVEKNVMICDRMDIFENLNGKHDRDQQMEEVKSRLEDVAKLSESFCLKNHSVTTEDDEDGKLLTPDDERSSDSGFRDKGSLSESVEDGCDEKYNLEDIEAELEQGEEHYTGAEQQGSEGETRSTTKPADSEEGAGRDERQEERLNKLDNALESDIDHFFQTGSQSKTGWYLHPPPGGADDESGWLPSEAEEEKAYRNLDINEEFVTAIRNELREKLPCAQNPERSENEEDVSPEEERTDLVIQYNTYPAPLSPIFEERESISSNQSSLLLDESGKSLESSGKSSPVIYLDTIKGEDNSRFEEDIKSALDVCSSESTESDNVLVTVEDLEDSTGEKEKVRENPKEEMDDLLIVDTETNKVILYESPRPKSQLAFVKQVLESVENSPANSETYTCYHSAEDNMLSVDRNNLTYTPDSCTLSPMSSGSSRTGVAVSFSSSETGGNLSGFYLSPSSVRSDLFDSGPPSLPFDLGLTETDQVVEAVEELKPNNEAEEIVQELVEAGMLKESEVSDSVNGSVEVTENLETETESREESTSMETPMKSERDSEANDLASVVNGRFNSNVLQICNIPKKNVDCDKIDKLLSSEKIQLQVPEGGLEFNSGSQEWLKSVLLGNSLPDANERKNDGALVCLNSTHWPRAEELLPVVKCEQVTVASPESPSMDLLEVAAKFYDVNSTLAISTPNNISFDESKDNSQLSSFTSTPTVENKIFTAKPVEKQSETEIKCIPSLSSLANEIVLRFPPSEERRDVPYEDSSPDESSERVKKLQGMTLALESSVVSKAPMPSPEDADKGSWRPTMNQLMELTSQPEAEDMMTTSFIDNDNDNDDNDNYAPDWESDSSDDSEDRSSSSGEFIWRDGDKEEAVRVVIACDDLEPQDGALDRSMARISEGEEEEGEDSSSCGSTTEFIPSTWDRNATPTKSALRSAEKQKGVRRNVSFKRQKYHCVYEYPREPGSDEEGGGIQRPCWQTPDYSTYTDWEYGEGEVESEEEEEEESSGPRQLPESEYDFYRLSNLDFDMMTQMNLDDGEFFISSSARPFQMGDSQFFPGSLALDDDFLVEFQPCAADTEAVVIPGATALDETVNTELREVVAKKSETEKTKLKPEELHLTADLSGESTPAEVSPTLGELRHTRERLKLDLGRADSGGEDSGVGSSDKLDTVEESKAGASDELGQVEDRKLWSSDRLDRVEESEMASSDKLDRVEDSKLWTSDKLDRVEDRKLWSSDNLGQVEESKMVYSDKLDRVEDGKLWTSDKLDRVEDSKLWSSDRLDRVEESEMASSDKLDRVEDRKLWSSDNLGQVEESKMVSSDKLDQVEYSKLWSSDKLDRVEDSKLWSSDKLDRVEDSKLWSSDKLDRVEERKVWASDKLGQVEESKTVSPVKSDRIEGCKLESSDKLDRVEGSKLASSDKLVRIEDSNLEYLSKLDRGRGDSGGEDSGVGSSDKLDQVEVTETTSEA